MMTLYQQVREFLNRTGVRPKKKLGQHFLIDPSVLQEIVWAAELTDADFVLEIGAGLGFLTSALADKAKKVVAIELDDVLYAELQRKFSKSSNVTLIQADILKVDVSLLLNEFPPQNTKVIANLPYYITTPILGKLLKYHERIGTCVLMVQTEVAQRIVAPPGNKNYGALSIGVSYYAQAEIIQSLSPDGFYPSPQVHSSIIKLTMRGAPEVAVENEALFFTIVRASFQARRKMLRNALLRSGVLIPVEELDAIFNQVGIDSHRRGETLDITEFADLANRLNQVIAESTNQ